MIHSARPGWQARPLIAVATLQRGYDLPVQDRVAGSVPILAANGPVGTHDKAKVKGPGVVTGRSGTIGKVAYIDSDFWPLNTSLYVKNFHGNHPRFVYYLLSQMHLEQYHEGAGVPTLNRNNVHPIPVSVPSFTEQQRIAKILDAAEALRAKRRTALSLCESLTDTTFLHLFGDPTQNPNSWPLVCLSDMLTMPLRNGLSPSHSGQRVAKVLTLSAITGDEFDPNAWKESTFKTAPPANQSVCRNDFLICRGNGNVRLVGKGYFPYNDLPDITFPDTMIAARVSPDTIERAFLQHMWNSNPIRAQVESLARTTNGTFKVNQTMLESISFISPPLPLQQEFARRVAAVERLKSAHRAHLAELDALFASLQHRAFRGEL